MSPAASNPLTRPSDTLSPACAGARAEGCCHQNCHTPLPGLRGGEGWGEGWARAPAGLKPHYHQPDSNALSRHPSLAAAGDSTSCREGSAAPPYNGPSFTPIVLSQAGDLPDTDKRGGYFFRGGCDGLSSIRLASAARGKRYRSRIALATSSPVSFQASAGRVPGAAAKSVATLPGIT